MILKFFKLWNIVPKTSRRRCSSRHYLLSWLFMATLSTKILSIITLLIENTGTWYHLLKVSAIDTIHIQAYVSPGKNLRACTTFLEIYVKWACMHEFSAHLVRLGEILALSNFEIWLNSVCWGIKTTLNWDNHCSWLTECGSLP